MDYEHTSDLDLDRQAFQTAFMFAPIGMAFLSLSGKWLRVNRSLCEILGLKEQDLLATTMESLLYPEDTEQVARYLQNIRDGAILAYQMEVRYRHQGGHRVWALQSVSLVRDADGNPSSLMVQLQDITLRKQAEESLRQSEERFRVLFEQAADIILLLEIAPGGVPVIRNANSATLRLLGYQRDELIGQPVSFINPASDASKVVGERRQNILSGSGTLFEARHRCKDGTIRDFECSGMEMQIGSKTMAISVERDITERKHIEGALRESEERFRAIFDHSNDGILLADSETRQFVFGNKTICRMLDYSPDEIKDLGVMDIHPPEDLPRIIDQFGKQARKEIAVSKDLPVKRKGGSIFYADVSSFPITLAGKAYLVGTFRDVSGRKQADEALQASEERYRTLVENQGEGIVIADLEERFTFANPAAEALFGVSHGQLVGRRLEDFMTPEHYAVVLEQTGKRRSGEKSSYEIEIVRTDGERRILLITACPRNDPQGRFIGTFGIFRDITERQQAEKSLRQSEERFRVLFEQAADIILLLEITPNSIPVIRDANSATFRLLGYERDELIGQPVSLLEAESDASKVVKERREKVLSGSGTEIFEAKHRCKDGTIRDFECSVTEMQIGSKTQAISVERDITERKRVEKQARDRMKELRAFYGLAELTEREGITPDKLFREFTGILPKSWQYPEIAWARIVIADREFRTENFSESPWKQSAPVKVIGSVVGRVEVGYLEEKPEEDEGPFLKEERLLIDAIAERIGRISERVRTEEQLRKLSRAIEQSPASIVITDLAGNMEYVNPKFTQVTGYSSEEALGQNPRILKSGEMPPEGYERLWKTITSGKEWRGEFRNKKKNGELYWESASISPVIDAQGAVISFLAVKEDITLRRQAEAERERLIAELKDALTHVKTLSGLLPICASCKKVRDDKGYWNQIEVYVRDHTQVDFSHSICPDCARKLYPEIYEKMMREKEGRP